MAMDLTGINNKNEYYTNHYFTSIFADNAQDTISAWTKEAKENEDSTPWNKFRDTAKQFYRVWDRYTHTRNENQSKPMIAEMASLYLKALGYGSSKGDIVEIADGLNVPLFHEVTKKNGAPLLWVLLSVAEERDDDVLLGHTYSVINVSEDETEHIALELEENNDNLLSKLFFAGEEAPRWIVIIGIKQIALIDRNKWNEKRYLTFDLDDIFSRHEVSTFQALAVLLHKESLCPEEGNSVLDTLDENSHKHSASVSDSLKYALRECIELLGNEVIYDMVHRQGIDMDENPVDAGELTIECLRYMYRFLFLLFIEARANLGFAPMESDVYKKGYSLEGLRDICEAVSREDSIEVQEGYYIDETISELFRLIYEGYPGDEIAYQDALKMGPLHDVFTMEPLKAHIFDPQYTKLINKARLRNVTMLQIVDLMSVSRPGSSKERRGRISYSALGINQMGAVYEALLSYRGFLAEETLFEVKRAGDKFNELDVGYFVPERELDNYTEEERVRYEMGDNKGQLRQYEKGTFIYRLAGREREKSASYYTPEVLTKCLVKYALKELLEGKSADEILHLTICEPAMGSAAFLNEAINQLAEAYLNKKQEELGEIIEFDKRAEKLQEVKMYIADRNVYGVDLNPTAVELAEVSLWLNTIYKNAYVPWFGTQLVCGNSLIGARRQTYTTSKLMAGKWFDEAPVRIMPGEVRIKRGQKKSAQGIYHFLMGDPGMANYTDKVIKGLEPENIKVINNWRKEFTKPYSEDEIEMLLNLSEIIDDLWNRTVRLRKQVEAATADTLLVYGQTEDVESAHTTIREKDKIYYNIYKSEGGENASPYARLKAAMDYWCALWFWPIDKAELLPDRQLFIMDMNMILEGGIASVAPKATGQMRFDFDNTTGENFYITEGAEVANSIRSQYADLGSVNLDDLRERNERLKIANEIAEQQRFMHWELEFADVFEENGGFDMILGNPPWLKIKWDEMNVLSDLQPKFVIKNHSAPIRKKMIGEVLSDNKLKEGFIREYVSTVGLLNTLGAEQNYDMLRGVQSNLYKCFLPKAWNLNNKVGVTGFVHPDGVFDDSNGGMLRRGIYKRLKYHFHFLNEKLLFSEVGHPEVFSLNIYSNIEKEGFYFIGNLFEPQTIDECFQVDGQKKLEGIKDSNGEWNISGHPDRVIYMREKERIIFAKLYDNVEFGDEARLPVIHSKQLLNVLQKIAKFPCLSVSDLEYSTTQCFDETGAQAQGIIENNVAFTDSALGFIYSGPHIGVANPISQTPRNVVKSKGDFDRVDLSFISDNYLQRSKYSVACTISQFCDASSTTSWGTKYMDEYKVLSRKMLNLKQERTLISAIAPPKTMHINGIFGMAFSSKKELLLMASLMSSIPYDFFIKSMGKSNLLDNNAGQLPYLKSQYTEAICVRGALLNCLTNNYKDLWEKVYTTWFLEETWGKEDIRLCNDVYKNLKEKYCSACCVKGDYERRQLLVEIDVLVSMALGLSFEELLLIYRIQFPVLQSYEADTWYDQNGRIVFTNNRSLAGVGFSRMEFEQIKEAKLGTFTQTIIDDTMPGGPIERTIEYVAPFDRCDREKDYEEVWHNFEQRFGKIED